MSWVDLTPPQTERMLPLHLGVYLSSVLVTFSAAYLFLPSDVI